MYLRLAFAVAAHLEPEILLVDEVLAVGDASFQQKCIAKMGDGRAGGTHDPLREPQHARGRESVRSGHPDARGSYRCRWPRPPGHRRLSCAPSACSVTEQQWPDRAIAPGNKNVRMHAARVRPHGGKPGDDITVKSPLALEFEYWSGASEGPSDPERSRSLNDQGIVVFKVGPAEPSAWHARPDGTALIRDVCHVPGQPSQRRGPTASTSRS